ncbi:uncharacterized protein [Typha angustifolia]|uniref:uncharacterized protein n=1 Tax=Typha angustifolia TaxID=59011 RepID=UPI003C306959
MSFTEGREEIHLPAEVNWEMLDKSRFFFLGAALFSGVTAALYPAVVVKTRLQVAMPSPAAVPAPPSAVRIATAILRREGFRGLYRGLSTSLAGTVPARALYMAALESTKSAVGTASVRLGASDSAAAAAASAAAGVTAAIAAQVVWTPVDVVSQRLMVADSCGGVGSGAALFKSILLSDGLRGLYRGFGVSILTYAPSNAVWWLSYAMAQRAIWGMVGSRNDGRWIVAVQGMSAAAAGGAAAVVTMPLDTIKTRLQVMDGGGGGGEMRGGIGRTVAGILKEGGWKACYRGLGPRWASMSLSAMTMITTYEFLKRVSAKEGAFTA